MEIARVYAGKRMAPQVGLEPTTLRLTAGCSAIELLRSVARLGIAHNYFKNHIIHKGDWKLVRFGTVFSFSPSGRDHSLPTSSNTQAFFVLVTCLFHSRGVYVGRSSLADFFP